ncbi:hypothetical protein DPMN_024037 [Dreissena polymorpha]|uniref:Uncharacterized protein n=1 Tax=Dreissena polymorpha TaxID=45954 RepID=A0A9D4LNK5_DREPO|nr:hypothetical protein DPMN_024037 [Dreissena polymorpha]
MSMVEISSSSSNKIVVPAWGDGRGYSVRVWWSFGTGGWFGWSIVICQPTGCHVFQATGTIFEIVQDIIGTNLLTKFHKDRTINVTSKGKLPHPLSGQVYPPIGTIFQLQDIIGTNGLTKFHDDQTINVTINVTSMKCHPKNALLTGGHVFKATKTIFKLIHHIIGTKKSFDEKNAPPLGSHTKLFTKFHEDWTMNVASRVLTRKNAPPSGGHVFQANVTIFELIQDIIGTKKSFDEVSLRLENKKNAPPPGGHVFQANVTIFELIQDIIGTNLLTKVLTSKNASTPG